MLPHRPRSLDQNFVRENSQTPPFCDPSIELPIEHHCQVCPTCSYRLTGHRCKLVCTECGYYMSCADYY